MPRATLVGLPFELRLLIYSYLDTSRQRPNITIGPGAIIPYSRGSGAPLLSTLSKTCRGFHRELSDELYKGTRFTVTITDVHPSDYLQPLSEDLAFLRKFRDVDIGVSVLSMQSEALRAIGNRLKRVIETFERSSELESIAFTFNVYSSDREKCARCKKTIVELKADSSAEGFGRGASAKERELDFATRMAGFLQTLA